jgi:predicted glutamine amidotransferase
MCGIVGMAGNIFAADVSGVFRDMLDLCQIRGRDATGVVRVHKDMSDYTWTKEIGPPTYLCDTKRYDNQIVQPASVLIGHCRAKTIGENTRANAHPFDHPEQGIVGVHNGTLRNYHWLEANKTGMTDSQTLYASIAQQGAEKTFTEVDGAFACVWWDQEDRTINFIRNSERPLFFAYSKDRKIMMWASEPWWFQVYSRRASNDLWTNDKGQWYFSLEELKLMSCRLDLTPGAKETFIWRKPVEIVSVPKKYTNQWNKGGSVQSPFQNRYPYESTVTCAPGWQKKANGNGFERIPDAPKGGEGASPFPSSAHQTGTQTPQKSQATTASANLSLVSTSTNRQVGFENNEIPNFLTTPIKTNKPSETSNVSSSTKSTSTSETDSTDSTKLLLVGKDTKKSVLSLPRKSGTNLLQEKKEEPLAPLKTSLTKCETLTQFGRQLTPVSHRVVAGLAFITNNSTGDEYHGQTLINQSGGCCSLCQFEFQSPTQIGLIINNTTLVCSECVNEPSNKISLNIR